MAKFLNNEPKFKVGDKVIYSRRRVFMESWEKESIRRGPLTISRVDKLYKNDELVDVTYFVEGLDYIYSEDLLSYASAGPKFKIGDKVDVEFISGAVDRFRESGYQIEDVLTIYHQKDGHEEYLYRITGWPFGVQEKDIKLHVAKEEQLIHDLEICGGGNGCTGCSRENTDGTGVGCDKLELDAAALIKKLQKRVKELEDKR